MLKIGDFSKLSRVSVRMLRHYDEIGLLRPAETDPANGYRYYSAAQLETAERIRVLKDRGFGLSVIGDYPDTEHVRFRMESAVTVASAIHNGSYCGLDAAMGNVAQWVQENGYELAGPVFCIYHVSPHETENPDEYVTEICYPVRGK